MNKDQIELKQNILKSLKRERNEVIGERERELARIDTRIMLVEKNKFRLQKEPQRQIKILKKIGLVFVVIGGDDRYLASWDVPKKRGPDR